jgi:hypothetical protein
VKAAIILNLFPSDDASPEDVLSRCKHFILNPAISFCDDSELVIDSKRDQLVQIFIVRGTAAILDTLTEFIECCCSLDLPIKSAETLERIVRYWTFSDAHPYHQLRLANAIKNLFDVGMVRGDRDTLLHHILLSKLFSGYAQSQPLAMNTGTAWLDHSEAHNTLKATFTLYLT